MEPPPSPPPRVLPTWVFIDGRVVPAESATISVLDRGFLYGDALFETFTTRSDRAAHLARLARGCARIEIGLPDATVIEAAIDQTVRAVEMSDGDGEIWVRVVVTRGSDGTVTLLPSANLRARLLVFARRLVRSTEIQERGVAAVRVVGWRALPEVKAASYLVSVLAKMEAAQKGADEALLVDGAGTLAEGATSNVLLVRDGRLATPPVGAILAGVTRAEVLALAASMSVPVGERVIDAEFLDAAEEIILTSSVRGLVPVVQLDGKTVGDGRPGPLHARLTAAYQAERARR